MDSLRTDGEVLLIAKPPSHGAVLSHLVRSVATSNGVLK